MAGHAVVLGTWLAVASAFALPSCDVAQVPLGSSAKDRTPLRDAPTLRHEAAALQDEGGEAWDVEDLYGRDVFPFQSTPDPTALLQAQAQSNPPAAPSTTALSFLTYNVALLDVEAVGFPVVRSPDLEARRPILATRILERGFDLVAVQEVWLDRDLQRFAEAAAAQGYWLAHSERRGFTDGLAVLVKKTFAPAPVEVGHQHYPGTDEIEFFPGPAISRGFMWVKLQHPTLGEIVVYNTHMAALPNAFKARLVQARELGLHLSQHTDPTAQVILAAGDMTPGPTTPMTPGSCPTANPSPSGSRTPSRTRCCCTTGSWTTRCCAAGRWPT